MRRVYIVYNFWTKTCNLNEGLHRGTLALGAALFVESNFHLI